MFVITPLLGVWTEPTKPTPVRPMAVTYSRVPLSSKGSSPVSPSPGLGMDAAMVLSDEPVSTDLEPSPSILRTQGSTLRANSIVFDNPFQKPAGQLSTGSTSSDPPVVRATKPATEVVNPIPTGLPQPQPQPQTQLSVVAPTITPPPTPHDNPEQEKPAPAGTNGANLVAPTLATFLQEASPFRPLGFLVKDLQEAGISTLAELKVIARKPEAFRTKIAALADLRERDEYLWLMFRKGLRKLLEGDDEEQPANNLIHESDPVRGFVRSLGGGECIDLEAFASGLRGAGISSERDLLVLSRNLEKYTQNIPFLREFAASRKLGWMTFQIGLEGLPGRETVQVRGLGASRGGHAYIKRFLDTIDFDKPLGHLTDGFIKAGLTDRIPLIHVAEDIGIAVDVMPFLQRLASGDQLVWAMILVGLEDLAKST